jgi:hypothetical protein
VKKTVALSRMPRAIAALGLRSAAVRGVAFNDIACRGGRLSTGQALEMIDDVQGCAVAADLLGNISVEILGRHNLDLALGGPRNGDHRRQQRNRQSQEDFHRQPQNSPVKST